MKILIANATITIHGRNVHPGSAKNKMVNAIHIVLKYQKCSQQMKDQKQQKDMKDFGI